MNDTKTRSDDEIEQVLDGVVMVSDRKFFARHPGREFRIRPAWEVEVEQIARVDQLNGVAQPPVPYGHCWWMLVWQVAPGLRMRHLFSAPHSLDPEPSEAIARNMWNRLTRDVPDARQFQKDARVILADK